jgi:hypothetical protein
MLPNKTLRKLSCWFGFMKEELQQDPRYWERKEERGILGSRGALLHS